MDYIVRFVLDSWTSSSHCVVDIALSDQTAGSMWKPSRSAYD